VRGVNNVAQADRQPLGETATDYSDGAGVKSVALEHPTACMTSLPVDSLIVAVEDRRPALVDIIRAARRDITLSLFRCNDDDVFAELSAAAARGVSVDVLVTSRSKGGQRPRLKLLKALERTGASVHVYSDPVVK
jgi:phosphatidylserine/phosphatidylglycerophosphate/cardiolipin synthase-like enzyme